MSTKNFEDWRRKTGDSVAAAIMVLAEVFEKSPIGNIDHLDHALCMGIRHGIYGASADNDFNRLPISLLGDHDEPVIAVVEIAGEITAKSEEGET